jgi:amino acid transporter
LSIAIMAPTAAMALNGVGVSALIGQAVPLAFIFATAGVMFVSYAFWRLSQRYGHSGSVYAFSGVTLGPRLGSSRAGRCSAPTLRSPLHRPPRRACSGSTSSSHRASGRAPTGS